MEAEQSQSADGERSGGQKQPLSESLLGAQLPPLQQQATSQSVHGSHGRFQHRQPKRIEMLQRQKQQQSQASGSSWQLSDLPGPSRGSCSALGDPSPQIHNVQQTQSLPGLEVQEGTSCRRERKPQKPGKYVCTYCGRPCAKPSVLQKHIRSHTGERPYPCVPCGFSFKTKSNLYKHRKSHAHRIKAGMASSREEPSFSGTEGLALGDQEEGTEGESTGSDDETGQHQPSTSQGRPTLKKSSKVELSFSEEGPQTEDSQAVKQRLAMRLSERKRAPRTSSDETRSSLGPGSKGSTESGYFSRSGSAELSQVSPPNASAKTYAEIILGKYGRLGQQQRVTHQQLQLSASSSSGQQEKSIPFSVPKTQVIEHITKLITINEAVVDTSEIDSVKPRRSSLSRRSSIESLKFSSPKDPCVFEPKVDVPGSCSSAGQLVPGSFASELPASYLPDTEALEGQCSSAVLYRSQSVPSSGVKDETLDTSARSFRLSHSFDEQQAIAAEMRIGSHQRMLRRQPAIEVPVGVDLISEDVGPSSSRLKESFPGKKQEKELHLYECDMCGTRLKKQDIYAAHRVACLNKSPLGPQSEEPQIMSYKFKAMAMAVRKRKKKEESLEEDPPSPGPTVVSYSTQLPSMLDSIDNQGTFTAPAQNEPERRGPWKEISVIQHTRSFEKQESISVANQEAELEQESLQEPKLTSTSRLIRQPNIQVPEILVTEEPDTEMVSQSASTNISKDSEKVEEFQWPQRSQSLAQLPAEKLPPKKKRLRLAEAAQSSGESSFESVSLPHSPSQESNVSHASSRSASFEESGRPDSEMYSGTWSSQGSHMLTVPPSLHQHHHSHREMRRSTSEQAPASPPHPAQVEETRSKSFDYGSLSVERTSATWKERRKCLLVKHATLGEPDQEEPSTVAFAKSGSSAIHQTYPGHSPLTIAEHRMGGSTSRLGSEHVGKTLQLFQSPLALPPDIFPLQQASPDFCSPGQLTRFLPVTTSISGVLSTQMFQQAFIHSEQAQQHPRPLQYVERLGLPLQPLSTLFPLQSSDVTQAVCFPMPGGLAIQVPSGPLFRESRTSPSSLHSPCQQLVIPHSPRPIIAPCLEQLAPVVSFVVPVRLQTHIPTYASAMYTTISQILATTQQPVCCTAMVIMGKLEENKLKRSYLRLPSQNPKSYIPLPLPLEHGAGTSSEDSCGQLGAGGSKRMLSPAGSLELSLEAQRHQKRVKEEEEEKEEDDKEDQDTKCVERSQEVGQGKNMERLTVETAGSEKDAKEVIGTKKLSKQDIMQQKTEPLKEERKELVHGHASRVTSPERTIDPYPSLHTTTSVSWCYLNYTKPNPSIHRDSQTSVYSSWSVSMHNPNLPGLSTKILLSLLRSKQKHSTETYTMATAPQQAADKLVPAVSKKTSASKVRTSPPNTPAKVKEEPPTEGGEKEEREKKKSSEDTPATSTQSEAARVCIFEGGYKSNEDYVYVRGRGRGKYVCGECGIRCKKPSMLKKHIRTHTDVRPYVCKHCNFAFKTKGNLTKHMKSKAHGKKCLEMGVSESSVDELEEAGGAEERVCVSEDQEEHQFSDPEDSEGEDDEDEDEEDEFSSHDEPSSACSTDTRQSTGDLSESGQSGPSDLTAREEYSSPQRPWPSIRAASPGSKTASFSRKGWEVSPRTFSPSSEGSPLRSLSPRLDLSSPSRHLSPSPERGPSPIRPLPQLRPLSPLRPVSPARYRSARALSSPTPLKPQHRPHSSPAGLHWEPSSPAMEGQQDKPGTQQSLQKRISPDPCLVSPVLRFSPNEPFSPTSVPPRTVDRMFSHLPLHSQDQARMPYHMIPIGGIQMVQLRPRSRPKLERQSSSTPSPTSPKEDSPFSLSRRDFPWILLPETSPQRTLVHSRTQSQDEGASQSDLSCPSTSSKLPKPPPLQQSTGEQQTAKVRKQYGRSSSATKTRTIGPETSRKAVPDSIEGAEKISAVLQGEGVSSSHKTRQLHEMEKPVVAPLRARGSSSEGSSGQQSGSAAQSQEGDPDST